MYAKTVMFLSLKSIILDHTISYVSPGVNFQRRIVQLVCCMHLIGLYSLKKSSQYSIILSFWDIVG